MAKHILVINDEEEVLQLFNEILHEEGGYDVTLGTFRPDIIEWIKELGPDLIIMDYIFGRQKLGWQLVDELKIDGATSNIPIIMCSAAVQELRERELELARKNIGVLYKPFGVDELLATVARYV